MKNILFLYKEMKVGGAENVIFSTAKTLSENKDINVFIATKNSTDINLYKRSNIKLFELPFNDKKITSIIKCLNGIKRICKEEKINIIHSHHRLTTVYALIIGKIMNIKVVHTEHNVFPDKNIINLRGKNIIAVSKTVKNNLIASGVKENNISVIYNGINFEKIPKYKNIKEELKINEETFCFGVIARLSEQKALDFLIKTVSLINTHIDYKVIIIGEGEEKLKLEALISKLNLQGKVLLVGQRDDIKEIISSIDCFILPSKYEGFPITNLEIMSNSKIVIATDVGGNSEIIKNEKNGFLIESQNKEQLMNIMNYVLNNKSILKKLGEAARDTIEANFNLNIIVQKYINYYDSLKREE